MRDFHTHSFLSDGDLAPSELVQRAVAAGYQAIAITDHVGYANYHMVIEALLRECEVVNRHLPIIALAGVEITHVAPSALGTLAERCKAVGAQVVVVHGETITEPVPVGTNAAALECPAVDILAHPGLLREEEAALAAARGVFIELSARRGHSAANGHVAQVCLATGARLLLNSDAHAPGDLLSRAFAEKVIRGAGLDAEMVRMIVEEHPNALLAQCRGTGVVTRV